MLAGLDAALRSCADPCSITVATYDYAQLVVNLACSVHRFQRSLVVVAADSGLCAILAAVPGVHACVEPESPRLALPKDAYVLKLEVAARAAELNASALVLDAGAVCVSEPSLPEGGPSLLGSFQDKRCVPTAERSLGDCASRRDGEIDSFATPIFAARGAAAGAALRRAVALLRDPATKLFGDQEALRESLRELGDRASWGFLPYPQFVRSMQWCWPDGCAGYSDAHTFHDANAGDVAAYAGAMTQRGLTAAQRVRTKQRALADAGLWLLDSELRCTAAEWRFGGFGAAAAEAWPTEELQPLMPAALEPYELVRSFGAASALVVRGDADAWLGAALLLREIEARLSDSLDLDAVAAAGAPACDALLELHSHLQPAALWERAGDADAARGRPPLHAALLRDALRTLAAGAARRLGAVASCATSAEAVERAVRAWEGACEAA